MTIRHEGEIVRMWPDGTGVLRDAQTGQAYYFTFDTIRGYRGESLKQMKVRAGSKIFFTGEPLASGNVKVTAVDTEPLTAEPAI